MKMVIFDDRVLVSISTQESLDAIIGIRELSSESRKLGIGAALAVLGIGISAATAAIINHYSQGGHVPYLTIGAVVTGATSLAGLTGLAYERGRITERIEGIKASDAYVDAINPYPNVF